MTGSNTSLSSIQSRVSELLLQRVALFDKLHQASDCLTNGAASKDTSILTLVVKELDALGVCLEESKSLFGSLGLPLDTKLTEFEELRDGDAGVFWTEELFSWLENGIASSASLKRWETVDHEDDFTSEEINHLINYPCSELLKDTNDDLKDWQDRMKAVDSKLKPAGASKESKVQKKEKEESASAGVCSVSAIILILSAAVLLSGTSFAIGRGAKNGDWWFSPLGEAGSSSSILTTSSFIVLFYPSSKCRLRGY